MASENLLQKFQDDYLALHNVCLQFVSDDDLKKEQEELFKREEQLKTKKMKSFNELTQATHRETGEEAALKIFQSVLQEYTEHRNRQADFLNRRQESLAHNKVLEADSESRGVALIETLRALNPVLARLIPEPVANGKNALNEVSTNPVGNESRIVNLAFTPGRDPLDTEEASLNQGATSANTGEAPPWLSDNEDTDTSTSDSQHHKDAPPPQPQRTPGNTIPSILSGEHDPRTATGQSTSPPVGMTPDTWARWPESPQNDPPLTVQPGDDDDMFDAVADDGVTEDLPVPDEEFNIEQPNASNQKRKRSRTVADVNATIDHEDESAPSKKSRGRGPNKQKERPCKEVARGPLSSKTPISFRDLGQGFHKHCILAHPDREEFFIMRCDVCGAHFGPNPVKGARTHLSTSPTHYSIRARRKSNEKLQTDIRQLLHRFGVPVRDCNDAKMMYHNDKFTKAIDAGEYVVRSTIGTSVKKARDLAYHPKHPTILFPRRQEKYRPLYKGKRRSGPSTDTEAASTSDNVATQPVASDLPGPGNNDKIYLFAPGDVYWFKGTQEVRYRLVVALPYKNLSSIGIRDQDTSAIVQRLVQGYCYHDGPGYYHSQLDQPRRRNWVYPVVYIDIDETSTDERQYTLAKVDDTWHFERAEIDDTNPMYRRLLRYLDHNELELAPDTTPKPAGLGFSSGHNASNDQSTPSEAGRTAPSREPMQSTSDSPVRETIEVESSSESTIGDRNYILDKGKGRGIPSPVKPLATPLRGPGSKPGIRTRTTHTNFANSPFITSVLRNGTGQEEESSHGERAPEALMSL